MNNELILIKLSFLFLMAFIVTIALTPIFTNFVFIHRHGKQIRKTPDTPIFTKLHEKKAGTPTMAGILVWGTVFIFAILLQYTPFGFLSRAETFLPLGVMVFAGIIGLIDDLQGILNKNNLGQGISVKSKLIASGIVSIISAWWFTYKLGFTSIFIPFLGHIELGIFAFLFFIFILLATSLSANETDGIDGLAGGVLLFAYVTQGVIAFILGRYDLAAFIVVIIGSLLAFLWFNIHPARFFMGDTGSLSLGATLGVVAMLTNTAILLPFFVPILVVESLSVIIQKISKKLIKKKVFISTPIHHHFEAIGWPETKITERFWIISVVSCVIGFIIWFISR
jgi:phospho-N-acetylmuramoyl-pentapeptide-transferase